VHIDLGAQHHMVAQKLLPSECQKQQHFVVACGGFVTFEASVVGLMA
jgi:hypothetical protein